ncbi:DNA-directed DNA polymerase [[Bacillus] selenitireducens MLS10]|uniref:DNA-directed DNA polymerase n=2 Tax=Salisediminibacterium selenitireducens TaxID=85683 RepID=D6Y004_BACIE|nr:DNA-directed DNA polymerase [[Bacillus] selenitireducens MLS10]
MMSSANPSVLSIDIETFSNVDLKESGVYAYAEGEGFTILLLAYAFDDEEVIVVDLVQDEPIPTTVLKALIDPSIMKTAYNANFERTCLAAYLNQPMPTEQWHCSSVHALTLGLPGHLDGVANVLNLGDQKDNAGKALIRYFSVPCKPTASNGHRTRNLPEHDLEKWHAYKAYCRQDVEVERALRKRLASNPIPEKEQRLWELDQRMNDEGVRIDTDLVRQAIQLDAKEQALLLEEAKQITGLENPNSVAQLRDWLTSRGIETSGLAKKQVSDLLQTDLPGDVRRVLILRQMMSKTSVKKYEAMDRSICKDGHIRGLLQFYGANRTGRWAGRIVQAHNLPKHRIGDLDEARQLVKTGNYELITTLYGSLADLLSQLTRTAFIPKKGYRFVVSDFSAIEARVIAWLAGERWRMKVFEGHGKIYEASASQMFGVPIEEITKASPLRQKGKIAELALGYGGAKGALTQMGALEMGLSEDELPALVKAWRKANPNIVNLWYDLEKSAFEAVKWQKVVTAKSGIQFYGGSGLLRARLPSGRSLSYVRPQIGIDERFGREEITYEGVMQGSKQWGRISTYGGKIAENMVQAIARDCLAEAMLRLDAAGYQIRFHVHDEVVIEVPNEQDAKADIERIMSEPIDWAPGLPMNADSFETGYYKKD